MLSFPEETGGDSEEPESRLSWLPAPLRSPLVAGYLNIHLLAKAAVFFSPLVFLSQAFSSNSLSNCLNFFILPANAPGNGVVMSWEMFNNKSVKASRACRMTPDNLSPSSSSSLLSRSPLHAGLRQSTWLWRNCSTTVHVFALESLSGLFQDDAGQSRQLFGPCFNHLAVKSLTMFKQLIPAGFSFLFHTFNLITYTSVGRVFS